MERVVLPTESYWEMIAQLTVAWNVLHMTVLYTMYVLVLW